MTKQLKEKITALIIDDEPHARQGLQNALREYDDIEILALCENGLEAVKAVNELSPQLLFLDIQMPKLDGFDVIELLGSHTPLVVFVTAYDDYAIKAFEANAVDYLLKPIDPKRLDQAILKIRERIHSGDRPAVASLTNDLANKNELWQRILVRDGSDVHIIATSTVCYIESAGDYVSIQTETASHIKLDSLSKLQENLDPRQFCRIHRSYLINISYLARIETESKDHKIAVLSNGKELPISRSGYASLKKHL